MVTYELVFLAGNVGDIHVVGRGAKFLELLASEDVNSNKMDLCMAMLASLGSRHVHDLAGTVLNDDEAVLPQGRALHGVGGGGASISRIESVLMLVFDISMPS